MNYQTSGPVVVLADLNSVVLFFIKRSLLAAAAADYTSWRQVSFRAGRRRHFFLCVGGGTSLWSLALSVDLN
jgi:hypothetical protein